MSELVAGTTAENEALACDCGHGIWWHHDSRGCGYLGFSPKHRCTCFLLAHEAAAVVMARAWEEGYTSGHSNAMRRMSDEPNAPTTPNPYTAATESEAR